MLLKIGELAKRTGLTVRTLHHYDAIGLLCPSARSDAGYRLYNRADIERLHRIQALRRMDLSLAEVAALLQNDGAGLQQVIEQQIALLDRQAGRIIELRDRLKALLDRVAHNEEPDLSDWLITLEMMAMYDKYFTREEVARLRAIKVRENKAVATEATELVARIRALMERGDSPESEEAQVLSEPWMMLAHRRMAGDPRLIRKLDTMHRNDPAAQMLTGVDGEMIDFMAKAAIARRMAIYAKYLTAEELQPWRDKFMPYRIRFLEFAAELASLMEHEDNPASDEAQALCARWLSLNVAVWGKNPDVFRKLQTAHMSEPGLLVGTGFSRDMLLFLEAGSLHLLEQYEKNGTETSHAESSH